MTLTDNQGRRASFLSPWPLESSQVTDLFKCIVVELSSKCNDLSVIETKQLYLVHEKSSYISTLKCLKKELYMSLKVVSSTKIMKQGTLASDYFTLALSQLFPFLQ